MKGRKRCPFEEIFALPLRNGLTRPKAVRGSGVKMVNMGEIFANSRIGNLPMDRVPLSEREAQKYLLEPGDLLFARQSLVLSGAGKCSIFLGSSEGVTFESHLIRARVNREIAYPAFYFYFFQSVFGRQLIESIVEQVAAAGIRGSDLAKLPVPLPPLAEQRAIARILGTLDDKIELNRQTNQTLEAMAAAIFKSWFVDFDPVRALKEGRQPAYMDAATARLFPHEFEESVLGEIPKGWRVGKVDELAKVSSGKRPNERSSSSTPEMNIPLYGGGGIMAYVVEPLYNQPILATGRVGTLGLVFRISRPCWTSDNTLVILPHNKRSYEYLYFLLKKIDMKALNRGSTQPLVTQSDIKQQDVVVPSQKIIDRFHFLSSKLFAKTDFNEEESQTLANIRDTLLPKLMSGEIRVKEAEKQIELSL